MENRSVAFHHFGCKVNFAEASAISRHFTEKGYQLRDFHSHADVYVISSCVVTAIAEKKCRAAIRQAHRINPDARIAVIGCFPELKAGELSQMEEVDLILGHSAKFRLAEELEKLFAEPMVNSGCGKPVIPNYHGAGLPETSKDNHRFIPSFSYGDRTRSFLKIQDGCDYYCTYCTIPLARGRSRSDTISNVLNNAREIIRHGIMEIVLTGVNLGDFGKQHGETFSGLLQALEKLEGIRRIRISSIEPDLLRNDTIDLVAASERLLPHFHIPLQSGSDSILKAMHRKYSRDLYEGRITRIRRLIPDACIAADVIVGFPGETDKEFEETFRFLENLPVSYLHVFSYSKRDNTLASKMDNPVPDRIKKERSDRLHELSARKKQEFYLSVQGTCDEVLFESDCSMGFMHGFTRNYIRVRTPFDQRLVNTIKHVTLTQMDTDGVYIVPKII